MSLSCPEIDGSRVMSGVGTWGFRHLADAAFCWIRDTQDRNPLIRRVNATSIEYWNRKDFQHKYHLNGWNNIYQVHTYKTNRSCIPRIMPMISKFRVFCFVIIRFPFYPFSSMLFQLLYGNHTKAAVPVTYPKWYVHVNHKTFINTDKKE